ncbi:MAG TPA: SRPBCC family protein [Propionicimonas sp.]
MPHASRTVVIAKPRTEVFAFLADAENDPTWRTGVISIKRDGPLGVGARYTQQTAGPLSRPIAADLVVTEYDPEVRVAFQVVAGPVRPVGSYVFTGDQLTTVTFTLDVTLTGIKNLLMSRMVQQTMDAEVAALDRAKALLESRR